MLSCLHAYDKHIKTVNHINILQRLLIEREKLIKCHSCITTFIFTEYHENMFAILHVFMYVYKIFILYLRHLCSNTLTHTKHKLEFIHENMFVKKHVSM